MEHDVPMFSVDESLATCLLRVYLNYLKSYMCVLKHDLLSKSHPL